jgi:catechol 2,3-dioxygenase-like lactoylglutathione lyase family enzyme
MINIQTVDHVGVRVRDKTVDHVGVRVRDKTVSISFYQDLGFDLVADAGFEQGRPVIMRHPSGVTLNLFGPSAGTDGLPRATGAPSAKEATARSGFIA